MKAPGLLFFSIVICSYANAQPLKSREAVGKGIHISFNKNIEFLGFAFFAGSMAVHMEDNIAKIPSGEMTWKEWHRYNLQLYQRFKKFADSPRLKSIISVAERMDGSHLLRLLLQLENLPNASINGIPEEYYLPYAPGRNAREAYNAAATFIDALNGFYKETDFDAYFRDNDVYYEQALKEITDALPDDKFIGAMEDYYQKTFHSYTLIPSLTIPRGMAFGVRYTEDGKTYIFNAFTPNAHQDITRQPPQMGFADEKFIREISTHEFGHSFSNPDVAEIPDHLVKATEVLFAPIKNTMDSQGYPVWKTCLFEHFVRASEIVIARNLGKLADAEALKLSYIEERKFIYLPIILEEFERYNQNKGMGYKQAVVNAMQRLAGRQ